MIAPVQVSHAIAEGFPWITPEYSSVYAFAPEGFSFNLVRVDHFALYNAGDPIADYPHLGASFRPRWMPDNELSYFSGNSLKRFDGANSAVLRAFPQFTAIDDYGEGDASAGSAARMICGDQKTLFVYNFNADAAGPALTLPAGIDSAYLTPSGNYVVVSWLATGGARFQGIELFDAEMNFIRQLATVNGHKDVSTDLYCRDVLVWTESADPAQLPGTANDIQICDLETGAWTPLLPQLDWSLAVHISCPERGGFCFVSTEQTPGGPVCEYQNQILRVWFNGKVDVLCNHGSNIVSYNAQPKVTCDRWGRYALFASNSARPAGNTDVDYADTFLVTL